MKVYNTNRLFFKKWLYKVDTQLAGASYIKRWGVEDTLKFCDDPASTRGYYYQRSSNVNKHELKKYITAIQPFLDKEVQLRAESSVLSFFLSDKTLYEDLIKAAYPWIRSITEPVSDDEARALIESTTSQVFCDNLPHEKFKYKVYLRYQMPVHNRQNFLEWIANYGDSVRPSKSTLKWLSSGTNYMQDPFIHVTDKNQLLLTKLYLGQYARNTQEFVLRNSGK